MNPTTMAMLRKVLPAVTGKKMEKGAIDRIGKFIGTAAAAGYGTEAISSFLGKRSIPIGAQNELDFQEQRVSQGRGRPEETAELEESRREGNRRASNASMIKSGVGLAAAGLSGAGAGAALQQIIQSIAGDGVQGGDDEGGQGEPTAGQDQQEQAGSYFQRASKGLRFIDLDEGLKRRVAAIKGKLDQLEGQGVPWESRPVQTLAASMRSLGGGEGFVEQEQERVNEGQSDPMQQAPQEQMQEQAGAADNDLMQWISQGLELFK